MIKPNFYEEGITLVGNFEKVIRYEIEQSEFYGAEPEVEESIKKAITTASDKCFSITQWKFKEACEKIVERYMRALGEDKVSVETWKNIAKVNHDVLEAYQYSMHEPPSDTPCKTSPHCSHNTNGRSLDKP